MHYTDKVIKKDLLISLNVSNKIKLLEVNNLECLCDFKNNKYNNKMGIYIVGYLIFFSFMNDNNNNNYYFMGKRHETNPNTFEVSDIKGNYINEITNKDNDITCSLYYDYKLNKN